MKRVVAGTNPQGRSFVISVDEVSRDGGRIWLSDGSDVADYTGEIATALEPPAGGSRIGVLAIAPGSAAVPGPDMPAIAGIDLDGFHYTRTTDYAFVIEGEITLDLDDESVQLEPGDVVVLDLARHAWRNSGAAPARLLSIVISRAAGRG